MSCDVTGQSRQCTDAGRGGGKRERRGQGRRGERRGQEREEATGKKGGDRRERRGQDDDDLCHCGDRSGALNRSS